MTKPVKIHRAFFVSGDVAIRLPKLRDSVGVKSLKITEEELKAVEKAPFKKSNVRSKKKKGSK